MDRWSKNVNEKLKFGWYSCVRCPRPRRGLDDDASERREKEKKAKISGEDDME
jgi:hypothetical protein